VDATVEQECLELSDSAEVVTQVLLTIDTELSSGLHRQGMSLADNLDVSIHARCREGDFGVGYQARALESAGLKAVFFIDPMPALIFGADFLKPVVADVLGTGHDVQLHLHTEWLDLIEKPPVAARGQHLWNFDEDEQYCLISRAAELLCEGGAPAPIAFGSGNYGADDRTLRALHRLNMGYDTSFNPRFAGQQSRISLSRDQTQPCLHHGVLELPVSCISDWPGRIRPAQLCALSAWEMRAALRHAVATNQTAFVIVSHSFELIARATRSPRQTVLARFAALCEMLSALRDVAPSCRFDHLGEASLLPAAASSRLPPNPLRTGLRMVSQLPWWELTQGSGSPRLQRG
jgi:hypothetical protein